MAGISIFTYSRALNKFLAKICLSMITQTSIYHIQAKFDLCNELRKCNVASNVAAIARINCIGGLIALASITLFCVSIISFRCQYSHWNFHDSLFQVRDISDLFQDVLQHGVAWLAPRALLPASPFIYLLQAHLTYR